MSDKEILEFAAKACGWNIDEIVDYNGRIIVHLNAPEATAAWEPLTDDGDAMRLAVKLKMEVCVWHSDTTIQTDEVETITLDHEGDPYAATRRAVVMVAAAIGEQM